jgi:energy-coupling factor transporter ATP-binding protein EcfA2
MVFQSPDQQMVATTVEREIAFGPENLGLPPSEIRARILSMMKQFKLEPLARRLPHQLSGGEKQRLALASVLAMQPEILILDEVTSLLDPCDRKEVLRDIRDMKGRRTILLITQFAEEALMADRILLMHEGHIARDGAPLELFAQATSHDLLGVEVPLVYRLLQIIQKKLIS